METTSPARCLPSLKFLGPRPEGLTKRAAQLCKHPAVLVLPAHMALANMPLLGHRPTLHAQSKKKGSRCSHAPWCRRERDFWRSDTLRSRAGWIAEKIQCWALRFLVNMYFGLSAFPLEWRKSMDFLSPIHWAGHIPARNGFQSSCRRRCRGYTGGGERFASLASPVTPVFLGRQETPIFSHARCTWVPLG